MTCHGQSIDKTRNIAYCLLLRPNDYNKERETTKMISGTKVTILMLLMAFAISMTSAPAPAQTKDIVDTAVSAGSFNTLAAALKAADLIGTLKGAGPFTVFAPTDDAFAKLPKGTLDALLKDPAKLKGILLYHVVSGKVMASDVAKMKSAKSVQGAAIPITVTEGKVMADNANVVKADIMASNGVIHVIDTVILPK
jgi:uncharacterized surface protein with fasciclin (FAS1) repeats